LALTAQCHQVLDDSRNWWQCRDINNRIGYVPNTILNLVSATSRKATDLARLQKPVTVAVPPQSSSTTSYDHAPPVKNVRVSFKRYTISGNRTHNNLISFKLRAQGKMNNLVKIFNDM